MTAPARPTLKSTPIRKWVWWHVVWSVEPGPVNPFACERRTLATATDSTNDALAALAGAEGFLDGVERQAWLKRSDAEPMTGKPYRYAATPDGCVSEELEQ